MARLGVNLSALHLRRSALNLWLTHSSKIYAITRLIFAPNPALKPLFSVSLAAMSSWQQKSIESQIKNFPILKNIFFSIFTAKLR